MTFEELKKDIERTDYQTMIKDYKGFREEHELEYYKTFFEMQNEPFYTLMQFQDSEQFNTKKDQWVLCLPQGDKLLVMDMGTEEEMCDQFSYLLEIWKYGFGNAQIREKK